ncbi:hypothetical protein ACQYAD_08905 [Neobacillus sp. SM06]|uniref:hypothetical protein n=1 Tax=Neobacillus sp. SM06 TaxID=3422492 RepID=UPI003D2B6AC1
MFRKILYFFILFLIMIDVIRGDSLIWFLIGIWFLLVGILIRIDKLILLKIILADLALKGDFNEKKAFLSGTLSILIGLVSYIYNKYI